MSPQRLPVLVLLLILLQSNPIRSEAGYHYDRPNRPSAPSGPPSIYTGHQFQPLPTVQPLPPIPALPPLPTARIPIPRSRPAASIVNHYLPPATPSALPPASVVSTYLTPSVAAPISSVSFHGSAPQTQQSYYTAPAVRLQQPGHFLNAAAPGPLRIPFGKQALISPGESYVANGRQLKQYAVIEIIDNDIDDTPSAPFLTSSNFFDRFRAQSGGIQLDSRANSLLLEQQSVGIQPRSQSQGDAIALGSGGLGYIRLANGNVYLGSGSLGYVSGQQRVASVLDARTRADSTPDALHFGHGPLGGLENTLRFK